MKNFRYYTCTILVILSCLTSNTLFSQTESKTDTTTQKGNKKKKWAEFTASTNIAYEFYHLDAAEGSGFRGRKPKHLARLNFVSNLTLWKRIALPFEMSISSQATNFLTPVDRYKGQYEQWKGVFGQMRTLQDVTDYLSNPINRMGLAPTFKQLKFYIGTHTPQYSELTQGNVSVFGGGAEWKSKFAFVHVNYGLSQHAINRDTTLRIEGAYKREQYSARLGLGNFEKTYLAFNLSHVKDMFASVNAPLTIAPKAGITGSAEWRLKIGKAFVWQSEIAACMVTNNLRFFETSDLPDVAKAALKDKFVKATGGKLPTYLTDRVPVNPSTLLDLALSSQVKLNFKRFGINGKMLYVGPGFQTLGYPFFVSDRFDATVGTNFGLFGGRANFSGTFGKRINNLSKKLEEQGTKLPTISSGGREISAVSPSANATSTTQDLINVNLNLALTQSLSLDMSYANFGIANTVSNDSLRVRNTTNNFTFAPVLNLSNDKVSNVFMFVASIDQFRDLNVISGSLNDNNNKVYTLNYTRSYLATPLTIGTGLSHFNIYSPQLVINSYGVNFNTGYQFFKKKLNTSLSVVYLLNSQQAAAIASNSATQILGNFRMGFKISKKMSVNADIGNTYFSQGLPINTMKEINGRMTLQQTF